MTNEEAEAISRRENGRVGIEVIDHHGRSYWITDVMPDERLRVMSETGRVCWWNTVTRTATPVKSEKRLAQERSERAL